MKLRGNREAVIQDGRGLGMDRYGQVEDSLEESSHDAEKAMKQTVISCSGCLVPPSLESCFNSS
jgi:hypothetical protein